MATKRDPVKTGDLRAAADRSASLLDSLSDLDWSRKAYRMTWSCRRTLDHLLNVLAWYSHDLAAEITEERGAARNGSGQLPLSELIFSLRALAEVLAIVAEAKPATARGLHNWGIADPEGFLAMGAIEISLHTWDIAMALRPEAAAEAIDQQVAGRILGRLFPDAPTGFEPVPTLLYVTGRAELNGRTRIRQWQWHSAPPA